jgi:hypothetical protein
MTRLLTPLIASTLFAFACTPVSPAEEVASDLELANGGLDTTDEAPEFDDPATFTAASLEADTAITDPMDTDAEVSALRGSPPPPTCGWRWCGASCRPIARPPRPTTGAAASRSRAARWW